MNTDILDAFPTIFALACEGLGKKAAQGSGLICCAIVGGAIVPPLTGLAIDVSTLSWGLGVPGACYAAIAYYGLFARKPATTGRQRSRPTWSRQSPLRVDLSLC